MNYILHGENTLMSREKFNDLKSGFDPSLVSIQSFREPPHLENQMFSQPKAVITEFFEKDDFKEFDQQKFFDYLDTVDRGTAIILWFCFELTISNTFLSQVKGRGFEEFKFSVSPLVFKIVDSFFEPKSQRLVFYRLLTDFGRTRGDEVFLIQMLIRKLRFGLWASLNNNSYKSMSGFIKRQAEFGKQVPQRTLTTLFESFVNLERKIKTGALDLTSSVLILYESF